MNTRKPSKPHKESHRDTHHSEGLTKRLTGVVASASGGRCRVLMDEKLATCSIRKGIVQSRQTGPVVGDNVVLSEVQGGTYTVEQVLPRRTTLSRADPHSPAVERIMAANADLGVIVVSVKAPPLHLRLIDRCLIAIDRGGLEPVICVNKVDLLEPAAAETELEKLDLYRDLGVQVVACSAQTGKGIDALLQLLADKVSVLMGHSGVGKSSLINALNPDLKLATNTLRKRDGKGRHTTTGSTLLKAATGVSLIDTPGVRELGLYGVDSTELRRYFPEFSAYTGQCKFRDCSHTTEPGCRVKPAVRDGALSRERYESYVKLMGKDMDDSFEVKPARTADSTSPTGLTCRSSRVATSFACVHCGHLVVPEGAGTKHRNHCPKCLWSLHVDNHPGDRASCCDGRMEPVAVWIKDGGEWALIHRCTECGELKPNRIAADDNEMLLLSLAVKPLSMPPFPLSRIDSMADR